jgi:hypothetical protein
MGTFLNSHIQQATIASRIQSQLRKITTENAEFGAVFFYLYKL